MRHRPLSKTLRELIAETVAETVEAYLLGLAPKRQCLQCGRTFRPRQRWHFLCGDDCRKEWHRGRIRPQERGRA